MSILYGECAACVHKGEPICVGCYPQMSSNGALTRTLFSTSRETITFSSLQEVNSGVDYHEDIKPTTQPKQERGQ